MRRAILSGLFLFASAITVSAEKIPSSDFGYLNWSGAAYTDDNTGSFSHCAVSANYKSGNRLLFSVNSDATVSVGVHNPTFAFDIGRRFNVSLYIDRRRPFHATAEAISSEMAVLTIPDLDAALTALKRGRLLTLHDGKTSIKFDLTGTFKALDFALNCAVSNLDYSSAKAPTEQHQPDQRVLYEIATNFITDMGLRDTRYLSSEETKGLLPDGAVSWVDSVSGVLGSVFFVKRGSLVDLAETDGGDIGFLSGGCDGEVATTAKNLNLTDRSKGRELRSLCVAADGSQIVSTATKVLMDELIFYTYFTYDGDAQDVSTIDDGGRKATLRAASYVDALDKK